MMSFSSQVNRAFESVEHLDLDGAFEAFKKIVEARGVDFKDLLERSYAGDVTAYETLESLTAMYFGAKFNNDIELPRKPSLRLIYSKDEYEYFASWNASDMVDGTPRPIFAKEEKPHERLDFFWVNIDEENEKWRMYASNGMLLLTRKYTEKPIEWFMIGFELLFFSEHSATFYPSGKTVPFEKGRILQVKQLEENVLAVRSIKDDYISIYKLEIDIANNTITIPSDPIAEPKKHALAFFQTGPGVYNIPIIPFIEDPTTTYDIGPSAFIGNDMVWILKDNANVAIAQLYEDVKAVFYVRGRLFSWRRDDNVEGIYSKATAHPQTFAWKVSISENAMRDVKFQLVGPHLVAIVENSTGKHKVFKILDLDSFPDLK